MTEHQKWEKYAANIYRLKVEGGYLYLTSDDPNRCMCFVPDVDLTRYQSHLRDAYNQGVKDGKNSIPEGFIPIST